MIDHTGVTVSDFAKSKAFSLGALSPIGYALLMERTKAETGHVDLAGLGEPQQVERHLQIPARLSSS